MKNISNTIKTLIWMLI